MTKAEKLRIARALVAFGEDGLERAFEQAPVFANTPIEQLPAVERNAATGRKQAAQARSIQAAALQGKLQRQAMLRLRIADYKATHPTAEPPMIARALYTDSMNIKLESFLKNVRRAMKK